MAPRRQAPKIRARRMLDPKANHHRVERWLEGTKGARRRVVEAAATKTVPAKRSSRAARARPTRPHPNRAAATARRWFRSWSRSPSSPRSRSPRWRTDNAASGAVRAPAPLQRQA